MVRKDGISQPHMMRFAMSFSEDRRRDLFNTQKPVRDSSVPLTQYGV